MKQINIAIIGAGMIGAAHASGYRSHQARLSNTKQQFVLHTVCDARESAAAELAAVWGFAHVATDWQAVVNNPEIQVISIALPNFLHAEVAAVALKAGKHVLFDIFHALMGRDSCSQTAMPCREYVLCGVDVAVMSGSALTTSPFSYSQACSTFRTVSGDSPATRTRLGGIPFVDHFKHH